MEWTKAEIMVKARVMDGAAAASVNSAITEAKDAAVNNLAKVMALVALDKSATAAFKK